ncbi:class I SAM-dependent methyltransferase [Aliidiomarina quisquiliarum]|uniref:class I SAM-dependent methyltransferase n=1 Tax=Aliidiomarina quisquiliarum TaxID=2938947 RepID=UPI00208E3333|nr:DUF4942 domain-containing protein [Aliidiomarina quisquiliarum]MCO4320004.1 DUF4942 domain-containing protein [Aliidiomarina quisquiliarum]
MSHQSTSKTITTLKASNEDFEWYPTTQEMIAIIKADMETDNLGSRPSVIDVGAGDGRVLAALTDGDKYAIEKSKPLLSAIRHNVSVIGTDFLQQTLIDKSAEILFCNPPYKEFTTWCEKIIREANVSASIYLVIPQRWKESVSIKNALDARNVDATVIFEGDFLQGDRAARAKVHIVKIDMDPSRHYAGRTWREITQKPKSERPRIAKKAFDVWFDEHFKISATKDKVSEWARKEAEEGNLKSKIKSSEIIQHKGLIEGLVEFYNRDLSKLMGTYQALSDLDSNLLSELDVNVDGVKSALRQRIKGLKQLYWSELFERLTSVTERLTSDSRKSLVDKLFAQTSIDFSVDNAHALALWVVKNANLYLEDQLVLTFQRMINAANVINYVSNQKTFSDEDWFYGRKPKDLSHFKLDHRVVLSGIGALKTNWFDGRIEGLATNAENFLNDLMTIASNIGFATEGMPRANNFVWDSGVKNAFLFRDLNTGKTNTLFEVKAFKNGNLHIKFNQGFICGLNCEFGRLKGWLKTREQAADELNIDIEDTAQFGVNLQLAVNDIVPRLGFAKNAP